ncbi:MAG: glycosyltransferase, partial [bacterium]|nr:glycosyltransferase [bacterium]
EAASATAEPWPGRVVVRAFVEEMQAAYCAADLVLSRAGAMTVAELSLLGVPAVLVPLPTAAENHQEYNARAMVRAGAAQMVFQKDLDAARLVCEVAELMDRPEALAQMGIRSKSLAVLDAAERIVDGMERAGLLEGKR